jgi:hypothetical protein
MKDHVPAGADQPGTLYVAPDGTVYRLVGYEQPIGSLMEYGDGAPWEPVYSVFTHTGAAQGGITKPDDAIQVWTPDDQGTPTVWLIVQSQEYDGWNGRAWQSEESDDSANRGYFTSKDAALAWIEDEKKQLVDQGRAKHDEELARKNAEAEARHAARGEIDEVRRGEYDALVAAGRTPSFDRPSERRPFKPQTSHFDEQVYLRGKGLDWEVIEVDAHEPRKETS